MKVMFHPLDRPIFRLHTLWCVYCALHLSDGWKVEVVGLFRPGILICERVFCDFRSSSVFFVRCTYSVILSMTLQPFVRPWSLFQFLDIVIWIPIARQRVCKHILATHYHATIGRLLLGNRAVNRLHQQHGPCFLCGPWVVYIKRACI
jgi:hypothetical protein